MKRMIAVLIAVAQPVWAETVVPTRTLRSQTILSSQDVTLIAETMPGALTHPDQAIGLEARVILYAGRPIHPGDLGQPALIERNQIVTLLYQRGSLVIATEARALDRAAFGELVRVMNLESHTTLTASVTGNGQVTVQQDR